jgi:hypothetical protein
MLAADHDDLTAQDIASEATWADLYRNSDRGRSGERYKRTREWHFVNIELGSPKLDQACRGHPPLPPVCMHLGALLVPASSTSLTNSRPS